MKVTLSMLTDGMLARFILRKVWQIHDVGGISMGRSPKNILLEAALHLMPVGIRCNFDAFEVFSWEELLDEAKVRTPRPPRRLQRIPSLARVSRHMLAILALRELEAWYEADAKNDPLRALIFEPNLVHSALILLPLPEGFEKPIAWTREALVMEAEERYRLLLKRENDRRFSKMNLQASR